MSGFPDHQINDSVTQPIGRAAERSIPTTFGLSPEALAQALVDAAGQPRGASGNPAENPIGIYTPDTTDAIAAALATIASAPTGAEVEESR